MTAAQGAMGSAVKTTRRRTQEQIELSKFNNGVSFIATIGIICLLIVIMASFSAILQDKNNMLREQNSNLQAEIDSLNTQIGEATNIERIERVATKKYGMVQPDANNYIAVSEEATVDQDLAAIIKDEAYN